jgi:hypothetical protein
VVRKLLVMSLVVIGLSCVPSAAYSQTSQACQQKQATLQNDIAQLQKAIQILEGQLTLAGVRAVRKRIAEIQSQIDDLRKVVIEKVRQLMSGDTGCRPFNDIPEAPKGGRSILVPGQGPPPQIAPPAPPKKAVPSPGEGFAMAPRHNQNVMLG